MKLSIKNYVFVFLFQMILGSIFGQCVQAISCNQARNIVIPAEDYICVSACNDKAIGENYCDWNGNATYYAFTINPKGNAKIVISINNASFTPVISLGYSCSFISNCFTGNITEPFDMKNRTTLYVRVEAKSGRNLDPDFQVCARVIRNSFDCYDAKMVVTRPENPTLDENGPFYLGETVHFCYGISFNVSNTYPEVPDGNNCSWLQGIVPVVYGGWDLVSLPLSTQSPPGGASWYADSLVHFNFESPTIMPFTFPDGRLGLNYGTKGLSLGDPMPAGWYWTSPGSGTDCTDGSNPDTAWGLPASCGSTTHVDYCFDLKIKDDLSNIGVEGFNDLRVRMFAFSDGDLGCHTNIACAFSSPLEWKGQLVSCDEEISEITGQAYIDHNIDGSFNNEDIALKDVEVGFFLGCKRDGGNLLLTTQTDENGMYSFPEQGLTEGKYFVEILGFGGVQGCCVTVDFCVRQEQKCDFPLPPPNCLKNPYSESECSEAIPLCNLTVIGDNPCSQNPDKPGSWAGQPLCGGTGVFHNTDFYKFIAGVGNYSINVTVFNCAGTGVQWGLMEGCDASKIIACSASANVGAIQPIPSSLLTPCQEYVFWIDGSGGSICSYYIQVTGDFHECSTPQFTDLFIHNTCSVPSDNTSIVTCSDQETYTVEIVPTPDAIHHSEYFWTISRPIDAGGNYETKTDTNILEVKFPMAGSYEICCHTSTENCIYPVPNICKKVHVISQNTSASLGLQKVCTVDFPFNGIQSNGQPSLDNHGVPIVDQNGLPWQGGKITLQMVKDAVNGEFKHQVTNSCGCEYEQVIRIEEALPTTGVQNLAFCVKDLPYLYDGSLNITSNLDHYTHTLSQTGNINGCDSLVDLSVRILDMGGTLSYVNDAITGNTLHFLMDTIYWNADRDSIQYIWKDASNNIIQNGGDKIIHLSNGTYTLEVRVFKYGMSCVFTYVQKVNGMVNTLNISALEDKISIIPNPNLGVFVITSEIPMINIEVFGTNGHKFSKTNGRYQNTLEVNIEDLPAGVYIVKINTDRGNLYKKVVKI